jgi:hypothetical protein
MLYQNANEHLCKITGEINQIEAILKKAYFHIDQNDYEACLWMLRNTLEAVCKNIFVNEISSETNGIELRQIIKKLEEGDKVPRNILPHIRTVQTFGNFGSHTKGLSADELNEKMIQPPISSMEIIYRWFVNDYHGFDFYDTDNRVKSLSTLVMYRENNPFEPPSMEEIKKNINPNTVYIFIPKNPQFSFHESIAAELLQKHIDDAGNFDKHRRAIVLPSHYWEVEDIFKNSPVISYGTRIQSLVTTQILGYEIDPLILSLFTSTNCEVSQLENRILFMSEDPGGTLEPTKKFIKSERGLKKYLSIVWKS